MSLLKLVSLSFFTCFWLGTRCQPDISWELSLGGTNTDLGQEIQVASSGLVMVIGTTYSEDLVFENSLGEADGVVTQLDEMGNVVWLSHFGGSAADQLSDIRETPDGGFIVVGATGSSDGDLNSNQGGLDFWVLKLDAEGEMEWSASYGGSNDDSARAVCVTSDQGYIVVGDSRSDDGDVSGNFGDDDLWVIKLTSSGDLVWEAHYGGSREEAAADVIQTADGGYIVLSGTESSDFDVSENYSAQEGDDDDGEDCWVLRLNPSGQTLWEQNFGGGGEDSPERLLKADDGHYVICGRTSSQNFDVLDPNGSNDGWVIQINDQGELEWSNSLGGSESDWINGITIDPTGGYIFAGSSRSDDEEVGHNYGGNDAWVGKLSVDGELLWEKNYGGTNEERANSVDVLPSGQIVFTGFSLSSDTDVETNYGGQDMWVVGLDPITAQNVASEFAAIDMVVSPNPAQDCFRISIENMPLPIPIEIFNSNGQRVKEIILRDRSKTVEISELARGTYLIKATAGIHTASWTLVVQ